MAVLRIGILSTADIALALLEAIKAVPSAKCTAVSSRSVEKARKRAEEWGIENVMTNEELVKSDLVDAIYVPIPTEVAGEWAVHAARSGKHLLVEKAFKNAETVQSILDACKESGVFFLDGTHFVHSSRTKQARKLILDGRIGAVRSIYAPFHVPIANLAKDVRGNPELEPYGVLGDVGWYSARAAVSLLGTNLIHQVKNVSVVATHHPTKKEVINTVQGTVIFEGVDGEITPLVFTNDFVSSLYQKIIVVGKLGQIEIPEFVVPHAQTFFLDEVRTDAQYSTDLPFVVEQTVSRIHGEDGFQLMYPKRETIFIREDNNWSQISKMVNEFCRMIREKDTKAAENWAEQTMITQKTLDMIFEKMVFLD